MGHALHLGSNGLALDTTVLIPLIMSISTLPIQRTDSMNQPRVNPTVLWARPDLVQALLPNPKGSSLCLYTSPSLFSILLGLNVVELAHKSGPMNIPCVHH